MSEQFNLNDSISLQPSSKPSMQPTSQIIVGFDDLGPPIAHIDSSEDNADQNFVIWGSAFFGAAVVLAIGYTSFRHFCVKSWDDNPVLDFASEVQTVNSDESGVLSYIV